MVSAIIGVVGLGLVAGVFILGTKHQCSEAYYNYMRNNKQAPPHIYDKTVDDWYRYL